MLTNEEKTLLHMLDASSRGQAILQIQGLMNTIIDADYIHLGIGLVRKLEKMTDVEFGLILWEMEQQDR